MNLASWLWFGFFGMAAGAVILIAMSFSRRTREEENHTFLHLFVCLTAMASYFLMATGGGRITLESGRDVFYARYVDWTITTPMLLTALSLTALHSPFRRWAMLLGLIFTDVYMILTGVAASTSPVGTARKWIWYLISCGAQAFIYLALWGALREEARKTGEEATKAYMKTLPALSLIWLVYPINFLLGDEGLGIYGVTTSIAVYAVMDVIAKTVYGVWSVGVTKAKASAELSKGEVPEHDLRPAPHASHEVKAPGRNELDPRYRNEPGTPARTVRA